MKPQNPLLDPPQTENFWDPTLFPLFSVWDTRLHKTCRPPPTTRIYYCIYVPRLHSLCTSRNWAAFTNTELLKLEDPQKGSKIHRLLLKQPSPIFLPDGVGTILQKPLNSIFTLQHSIFISANSPLNFQASLYFIGFTQLRLVLWFN